MQQTVNFIEEPLTPREGRLERAARVLRWGAIINGVLAGLIVLAAVIGALLNMPSLLPSMHNALMMRTPTLGDDVAVLTVLMMVLVNVSFLLVVMVGVLAQEFWSVPIAVLVLIANFAALGLFGFTPSLLSIIVILWMFAIVIRDLRSFRANPVMLKELRERMRGARAFAVITVYLSLMSAFSILLYLIHSPFNRGQITSVTGDLGRTLFMGLIALELMLIVFIAPAFTAGAVTGERERKTFDLLQITLLPRPSFIIGKLESALGYILLLLLAAIPLQSIAFLFGGVTESELILAFEILAVTAITLGTVGLFFSTVAERTLTASVRSYTFAFVVLFGIPILSSLFISMFNNALAGAGTGFNGSPVVEAIFLYLGLFTTSINPITTLLSTQQLLVEQQETGFWTATLNSNGATIPMVSPWVSFTIIYLVVSAVLIVLAVRRMRNSEF